MLWPWNDLYAVLILMWYLFVVSSLDMIEYLRNNLCRVQSEYKDMLQQVGQAVPPRRHSSTESSDLSDEAASYLARMKARSSPRRPR